MTRPFSIRMTIGLITAVASAACSTGELPRAGRVSSDPAEQNIKQLEVMRRPTRGSLDATRDELIAAGSSLNAEQIERLMAVALDTGKHKETRKAAIAVVLAAVQNKDFAPVQRLCDGLRSQATDEALTVDRRNESQELFQRIIASLTQEEALSKTARSEAGNRMLLEMAVSRRLAVWQYSPLVQWLTELNPDKAVGSTNALSLVIARPDSIFGVDRPIIAALNDSALIQLRTLVRESAASGKLHGGAASTLAHLGDDSIRVVLQQYSAATNASESHRTCRLIWQIEIQKTNADLLAFLATPAVPQDADHEDARLWALNRAVERKIPRDEIRAALFKHAETVKPETRTLQVTSKQPAKIVTSRYALASIKCEAVRLGILTQADWPDVGCVDAVF